MKKYKNSINASKREQRLKIKSPLEYSYDWNKNIGWYGFLISKVRDTYKTLSGASRTVERIGLIPEKHLSTTFHEYRHAYGLRSSKLGIPNIKIKNRVHNKKQNF